jgi:hypothetical protein
MFTSLLSWPVLVKFAPAAWSTLAVILALGFLASGGSASWNSIQTYILKLKDIESAAAKTARKALREGASVEKPASFKVVAAR